MSNLLRRLETALSKLPFEGAKEDGESHQDRYKCDCGEYVPEDEWCSEYKCCSECYAEHYGDFVDADEAEYKMEDR